MSFMHLQSVEISVRVMDANDLGMPVQNYTGMRAHRPEFTGQDQELKSAPKKKLGENRSTAW